MFPEIQVWGLYVRCDYDNQDSIISHTLEYVHLKTTTSSKQLPWEILASSDRAAIAKT